MCQELIGVLHSCFTSLQRVPCGVASGRSLETEAELVPMIAYGWYCVLVFGRVT